MNIIKAIFILLITSVLSNHAPLMSMPPANQKAPKKSQSKSTHKPAPQKPTLKPKVAIKQNDEKEETDDAEEKDDSSDSDTTNTKSAKKNKNSSGKKTSTKESGDDQSDEKDDNEKDDKEQADEAESTQLTWPDTIDLENIKEIPGDESGTKNKIMEEAAVLTPQIEESIQAINKRSDEFKKMFHELAAQLDTLEQRYGFIAGQIEEKTLEKLAPVIAQQPNLSNSDVKKGESK
ncbi:hypothetical protein IPF37_01470 [bacterium]|nr:MAG: hypothetical protein IPF37_01470 [bacterium]